MGLPQKRMPQKAMVLAAGFGVRMLPLSRRLPKPLLPLWGRPVLEHILRRLARWGVREVVINCHHRAELIVAAACRMSLPGLRLSLNYEPRILGTGGALAGASWFLAGDRFWVVNGDILVQTSPRPMLAEAEREAAVAVLLVTRRRGPRTILVDREGRVRGLSREVLSHPEAATFTGVYLADPRLLEYVTQPPVFESLVAVLERAMRQGESVRAVAPGRLRWADLGTPEGFLAMHRSGPRIRGRKPAAVRGRLEGVVTIQPGAVVEPGSQVRDAVLCAGCRIRKGAVVSRALVGPGAVVSGRVEGMVAAADEVLAPHEVTLIRRRGWDPRETCVQIFSPRGSDRRRFRLVYRGETLMLTRYGTRRPENELYAPYARFLTRLGLKVPRVVYHSRRHRLVLEEFVEGEDLVELADRLRGSGGLERWYRRAVEQLVRLHLTGLERLQRSGLGRNPPLNGRLLRWERQLFRSEFAERLPQVAEELREAALRDVERAAIHLRRRHPVLLHRDFQSSNLRVTRNGELCILDFQGMRAGPAAYDLASLLCDPYVCPATGLRERLLRYYGGLVAGTPLAAETEYFWWAAVQRLAQALGAYGRLSRIGGMEHMSRYFDPALRLLAGAAGRTGLSSLAEYCDAARAALRTGRVD